MHNSVFLNLLLFRHSVRVFLSAVDTGVFSHFLNDISHKKRVMKLDIDTVDKATRLSFRLHCILYALHGARHVSTDTFHEWFFFLFVRSLVSVHHSFHRNTPLHFTSLHFTLHHETEHRFGLDISPFYIVWLQSKW